MNSFLETNESSLSVGREERIQNSLLIYEQTYIRGMHRIPRMGFSAIQHPIKRLADGLLYKEIYPKLREKDLNLRPPGYEPDELPDCSIPRRYTFS